MGHRRCKLPYDDGRAKCFSRVHGAIAQLVEHLHGMQGVRSSSLLGSIVKSTVDHWFFGGCKTAFLLSDYSWLRPVRAVLL